MKGEGLALCLLLAYASITEAGVHLLKVFLINRIFLLSKSEASNIGENINTRNFDGNAVAKCLVANLLQQKV